MADKQIRILSMGAGVQTTAMLLKFWERYKEGYIVFADTGDEKKETYWYIEKYLKPFCKEKGLKWVTVRWGKYDSLMDWCFKKRLLPIKTKRQCTIDFKVRPIQRFARKIGATKENPVIQDIGISLDESHRANFGNKYHTVKYISTEYPLLDHKITRRQCQQIIQQAGWPVPPKSGCDFCPFAKRSEFRRLSIEQPQRFKKIVQMEKNDRCYPKYPLDGRSPLENILNNKLLDDFIDDQEEDTCDSGHCFT